MGVRVVAVLLAVLSVTGCRPRDADVVIGMGSTVEQGVLAALTVRVLEEAGVTAELQPVAGGTVGLRREAVRGNIDLFWDYTGAAWALGMGEHTPPADPDESYARVRAADERNDLVWLEPTAVNATLTLFVRPQEELRDMSDVAGPLSGGQVLCADPDFIERPGGLDAVVLAYDIGEGMVVEPADEDAAIDGVVDGACFAGLATATSGRAWGAGLRPVRDDLRIFPAFIVAPVARRATHDAMPQVRERLAEVALHLDTAVLGALNAEAEAGAAPEEVAAGFLERIRESSAAGS